MGLSLRDRLSLHFRKGRDAVLRDFLSSVTANSPRTTILDAGGRMDYWQRLGLQFLRDRNVRVTLLNLNEPELPRNFPTDLFETKVGNACDLSDYDDGHFDIVHSNSVVEHVGTWNNMQSFARETRRVGKNYYVQTPYFWFPIDPHFYAFPMFHWFSRPIKARLLNQLPLASAGRIRNLSDAMEIVDGTRLLDARQFSLLFPDSKVIYERFLALPKSMIAMRRG